MFFLCQVYSLLTQQEVDQIGKCLNALRRAIDEHSLIVSPTLHHHPYQFQIQQQKHSGDSNRKAHILAFTNN